MGYQRRRWAAVFAFQVPPSILTHPLAKGKLLIRNEIEFGEYRKYEADATVTFGAGK